VHCTLSRVNGLASNVDANHAVVAVLAQVVILRLCRVSAPSQLQTKGLTSLSKNGKSIVDYGVSRKFQPLAIC
jgi:hypothetical protein